MSYARPLVWLSVAAALLAAGLAAAHEAPRPREYETRLIHDCIDDYFGGDQPNDNRPGHDVMALDVREAYDEGMDAHVLVFRLLVNDNAHSGSELEDKVSFKAKSTDKTYSFKTQDNQRFTGTFEKVTGPTSLNDGVRFAVEGTIKTSTLGLKVGDKISSFKVESFAGGTRGDFMPGSYDSSLGPGGSGCPVGSQGGDTRRPDYTLEGPTQYASWRIEPTRINVPPGTPQLVNIRLTNELRQEAQAFTLTAVAEDGVAAEFHDIAADQYSNPYEFDVAKDVEDHLVHLRLTATGSGATGVVEIELRTHLGGRLLDEVAFTVGSAGSNNGGDDAPDASPTQPQGGLPGPGLPLALAATAAALLVGRQRQ